mgnify:CR=1 FL=1
MAKVFVVAAPSSGSGKTMLCRMLLERLPFWLLLGSLVLRAGVPLLGERLDYEAGRHTIALAGMLAWLAVAIFAFSVARAVRAEPRTKRALDEVVRNARRP